MTRAKEAEMECQALQRILNDPEKLKTAADLKERLDALEKVMFVCIGISF